MKDFPKVLEGEEEAVEKLFEFKLILRGDLLTNFEFPNSLVITCLVFDEEDDDNRDDDESSAAEAVDEEAIAEEFDEIVVEVDEVIAVELKEEVAVRIDKDGTTDSFTSIDVGFLF